MYFAIVVYQDLLWNFCVVFSISEMNKNKVLCGLVWWSFVFSVSHKSIEAAFVFEKAN